MLSPTKTPGVASNKPHPCLLVLIKVRMHTINCETFCQKSTLLTNKITTIGGVGISCKKKKTPKNISSM